MSEAAPFSQFVAMTERSAREEDEFLPTFVDPVDRVVRVLEGVPAGGDVSDIARKWALQLGKPTYFLAYAQGSSVIAEAYEQGVMTDTASIPL